MSLFEDTNPRALKDLLSEIQSRTMVLPNFQRDFVWEPSATQELIVSIAHKLSSRQHSTSPRCRPSFRGTRVRGGTEP